MAPSATELDLPAPPALHVRRERGFGSLVRGRNAKTAGGIVPTGHSSKWRAAAPRQFPASDRLENRLQLLLCVLLVDLFHRCQFAAQALQSRLVNLTFAVRLVGLIRISI